MVKNIQKQQAEFDPLLAVQPADFVKNYMENQSPTTPVILQQPKLSKKDQRRRDRLIVLLSEFGIDNPEELDDNVIETQGQVMLMWGEEAMRVCPEKLEAFSPRLYELIKLSQ